MKKFNIKSVMLALAVAVSARAAVAAPTDVTSAAEAIKLYQQQSYKPAVDAFEQLFKKEKPTADNLYYAALSNQQCGQSARAQQLFEYIVSNFPETRSAHYAKEALKNMQGKSSASEPFAANHDILSLAKSLSPSNLPGMIANTHTARSSDKPAAAAKYATMFYESTSPSARKILFIGNSLTFVNQLPIVLTALAINSNTVSELRVGEVVEGGATLERMFNGTNAVKAIKEDGPWTDVVLQDQSETPVLNSALTLEWSERFAKEIQSVHARPVLFETWSLNGKQSLQPQYHDVYMQATRAANGLFVPAGDAFLLCHTEHPEIELYGDDRHPTQQGTYLAACVFYKKLFNRSPVGLPSDLSLAGAKLMNISASVATTLQNVALRASSLN